MPIFIDAHVHIHPEFTLDSFFSAAWNNFSLASKENNISGKIDYVLALTEGAGCDVFSSLKEQAVSLTEQSEESGATASWKVYLTAESDSLIIRKKESSMYIIAGRQLVSKENIEVLSLFSSTTVLDRSLSLNDLARKVSDNGGLPAVPWGVGKWFAERGKVVERFLNGTHDFPILFGDNGNRPGLWPLPKLIRRAQELGIPVLSGSDPLPLTSHTSRPASLGGILKNDEISSNTPIESLQRILKGKPEISGFGHGVGAFQFFVDQLQINLRNKLGSKPRQ